MYLTQDEVKPEPGEELASQRLCSRVFCESLTFSQLEDVLEQRYDNDVERVCKAVVTFEKTYSCQDQLSSFNKAQLGRRSPLHSRIDLEDLASAMSIDRPIFNEQFRLKIKRHEGLLGKHKGLAQSKLRVLVMVRD